MPAFDRFYYTDDPDREPCHHGAEAGESLAATVAAMFAARGNDFAVGLLVNAEHFVERLEFLSGGKAGQFSRYRWLISVPPPLYALYQEQDQSGDGNFFEDRDDFVAQAWRLAGPLMENIAASDIVVSADLLDNPRWRETARSHLAGAGVTNQGNVHVQTRPKILHDELWFRHTEEQYIYEALLRRGHPFMPLPVVMRANGKKRPNGVNSRIEPDFCILYKGRLVVLEVDGGSHWESPADAEKRVLFLREHGAIVRHISADDCGDQEKAALAVADKLRSLDAELARGGRAQS
ncbi:MAG TPA: hypothetical protein VGD01_16485 [Candidatus Elarobacter sp.]|jgi:hypothetical protein